MAVSLKSTSMTAANFADNRCRWDGQSGPHYEVWFLTLNHRESERGFWFRYTVHSPIPTNRTSHSSAGLWAAVFRRRSSGENLGLKRECSIDEFSFDGREEFRLKIADGLFTPSRAMGRVKSDEHSIEWDLRYEPCQSTYQHVTRTVARLARPSSFVCSPNLDTRFSGRIDVDGEQLTVENEPGCQSHLWGRKHVDEWVWVHSNAFENHPGTVFEGLAARPRRAGHTLPPIQSLLLRHRGEEHHFTRLRFGEQWRDKLGMGYWSFSARNTRVYIEGAAQCRLRDMLEAEYFDPDGEPLYAINSEVANLRIRLFRRTRGIHWRHVETFKAYGTAHLEHASRASNSLVQRAF